MISKNLSHGKMSDDSRGNKAAQPASTMIRARDYRKWNTQEGHRGLKVEGVFFYVDYRMLASTNPGCPQTMFDTLNWIFNG